LDLKGWGFIVFSKHSYDIQIHLAIGRILLREPTEWVFVSLPVFMPNLLSAMDRRPHISLAFDARIRFWKKPCGLTGSRQHDVIKVKVG